MEPKSRYLPNRWDTSAIDPLYRLLAPKAIPSFWSRTPLSTLFMHSLNFCCARRSFVWDWVRCSSSCDRRCCSWDNCWAVRVERSTATCVRVDGGRGKAVGRTCSGRRLTLRGHFEERLRTETSSSAYSILESRRSCIMKHLALSKARDIHVVAFERILVLRCVAGRNSWLWSVAEMNHRHSDSCCRSTPFTAT